MRVRAISGVAREIFDGLLIISFAVITFTEDTFHFVISRVGGIGLHVTAGRFDGLWVFLLCEERLCEQCRSRAGEVFVSGDFYKFIFGLGIFFLGVITMCVAVQSGIFEPSPYFDNGGETRFRFVILPCICVCAAEMQQQIGLVVGCQFIEIDSFIYSDGFVVHSFVEVDMSP